MKKITIILTALLSTFNVLSQDTISNISRVSKSNIGKMYQSNSIALHKEFIEVDRLGSIYQPIKFEVLNIYDFKTNIKTSGVRIEVKEYSKSIIRTEISYIDKNELDDIITSLNTFKSYINSSKDTNYVELTFRTKDDFEITCFLEKIKKDNSVNTKNVKTYIDTKESFYEGKQVNKDEKGTYIWKTVSETDSDSSNNIINKWKIVIESGYITKSKAYININKLDTLIEIFEQCKKIIN